MTTITAGTWTYPRSVRDPLLAAAGLLLVLLVAAFGRHLGQPPVAMGPWMTVHLLTIIPAVPLGAVMLLRPKGDRLHRLIGRVWVALMMIAALASFGVRHLTGHLSLIHILSVVTLLALPRAILDARAGRIARHRRTMTIVYAALVIAGYFTLIPTRTLGGFLFG
ncbi:DUF2306 domain-containing protein [Sphingomonas sp.]|uniref:DUF2306 domain-containing protein n=1 Tax=Sphingomonas sp. TaxID=28214 RepID=UPI003B3BB9FB